MNRVFETIRLATFFAMWVAIPAALLIAGLSAGGNGWPSRLPPEVIASRAWDKEYLSSIYGRSGFKTPRGYGNQKDPEQLVLVMGDSHVDHYAKTLAKMGGDNIQFLHLHGGSCFFGKELIRRERGDFDGCPAMNAQKAKWLAKPNIDAVIHGQRWIGYMGTLQTVDGVPMDFPDVPALIKAELADLEKLYADFKGRVILVNGVPGASLTCLTRPRFLPVNCDATKPTDMQNARLSARLIREFVASRPKFSFVDPADTLCSGDRCEIIDPEGHVRYFDDSGHITIFGARLVVPGMLKALLGGPASVAGS